MNATRVVGALFLSFCCWPCLSGCMRVKEPIGSSAGGRAGNDPEGSMDGSVPRGGAGDGGTANAGTLSTLSGRAGIAGWGGTFGLAGRDGDSETGIGGYGAQVAIPVAGFSGADGYAGGGGRWAGAAGYGGSCSCDDGDLCTYDYCDERGCVHENLIVEEVDADDDGFYVGCDCDDQRADIYPGQPLYLDKPRYEDLAWDYDYNCHDGNEPRLTGFARDCEFLPDVNACVGEGWLNQEWVPDCGQEAQYQACEFKEGDCVARMVATMQRCR